MVSSLPGFQKAKSGDAQQLRIPLSATVIFRRVKNSRGLALVGRALAAAAVLFFIRCITHEPGHGHLPTTERAASPVAAPTSVANTTGGIINESSASTEENFTEWTGTSACGRPGLRILYFVHTAPKNVKKRAWLRKTIGDPKIQESVNSAIVFFVGVAPDANERELVEEEAAQQGDVVVLNFTDTYRNLSLKFVQGAKWVQENCLLNSTTTIVKMDDDVLVNAFALSSYVDSLAMKRIGIHCCLFTKVAPQRKRKSKWYVSKEEYSLSRYPAYCAGAAFMMRPAVLSALYEASTHVPIFWVDDVYVTGILASLIQVDMVDITRYFGLYVSKEMTTVSNTMLFVHTGRPNSISRKIDYLWRSVLRVGPTLRDGYRWRVRVCHRKTFPGLADWVISRTRNANSIVPAMQ